MLQSFMPTLASLHTQTTVLFVLVAYCYTYHHYVLQLRVTNDRLLNYQSYSTENRSNCLGHQVIYPRTRVSFRHDVNTPVNTNRNELMKLSDSTHKRYSHVLDHSVCMDSKSVAIAIPLQTLEFHVVQYHSTQIYTHADAIFKCVTI